MKTFNFFFNFLLSKHIVIIRKMCASNYLCFKNIDIIYTLFALPKHNKPYRTNYKELKIKFIAFSLKKFSVLYNTSNVFIISFLQFLYVLTNLNFSQ